MPRRRLLTLKEETRRKRARQSAQTSRQQGTEKNRSRHGGFRERNSVARICSIMDTEISLFSLGEMNFRCRHCNAKLFRSEINTSICCHKGKIKLPDIVVPQFLRELIEANDSTTENYLSNIRQFNNALAFASVQLNAYHFSGSGPYCLKTHGQIYHVVGTLTPENNVQPSYAGLFILDSKNALNKRMERPENKSCDKYIMQNLQELINQISPYAQLFHHMKDLKCRVKTMTLKFSSENAFDRRRYNIPVSEEIAAAFMIEDGAQPEKFDFVVRSKGTNHLSRISNMNPHVDPLCYPLIFPCGDAGWQPGMKHVDIHSTAVRNVTTQLQYYCYRLAIRDDFSLLHASGKLFQQYIVDAFVKVESSRLGYIVTHQRELRTERYKELRDFVNSEEQVSNANGGIPVILPSTFIGSPRNMIQNYTDAMAVVARYGKPDLFITFTANPRWKEIVCNLKPYERVENRPDLVTRVFYLKLRELLEDLYKNFVLGVVVAYVHVIEFQKRGLPHCHILLILRAEDKIRDMNDIDAVSCAELPDPTENPRLFEIVQRCMIHGPCGTLNPAAPCMDNNVCTKGFPKDFITESELNDNGYPLYRRRNNGRKVKNGLDNRWVVPYNPYLCLKFDAHINVEICSSFKSVKYLYKFIYKGHDAAGLHLREQEGDANVRNEVNSYMNVRYVSAPEAMWRLHERELQDRSHKIERLPVHLPEEQQLYFLPGDEQNALQRASTTNTKLTAYFQICMIDEQARSLLYVQIPEHYTWNKNEWKRRQRSSKCIGRIFTVSPADRELYCLRVLLLHVKGCQSYEKLKTVNGVLYPSFAAAAGKLNLLDSEEEWPRCLEEASLFQMPKQLRELLAFICVFCVPKDVLDLWAKYRDFLSEDFQIHHLMETSYDLTLQEIDKILKSNGTNCNKVGLPIPRGVSEQKSAFKIEEEKMKGSLAFAQLKSEQLKIANEVLHSVQEGKSDVFFIDGPGGTGKTFLYRTLCHILRGQGRIVLPVAWTGIAAQLLEGGKTAHSLFKLPVPIHESSVSRIREDSVEAMTLRKASLIIWDEVSMVPKHALNACDKLLRDLMKNSSVFGGKVIVFGGDFRQTLPVIRHSSRLTVVENCVKSCVFWKFVKKRRLTENIRAAADKDFSQWLLKLGNGTLSPHHLHNDLVEIPSQCMCNYDDLIQNTFHTDFINSTNINNFTNIAILCTKNDYCTEINDRIVNDLVEGSAKTYYSVDSVESDDITSAQLYPLEFLHSLTPSGLPPHVLQLKINTVVMLIRNLNVSDGLVNGTRMIVKDLHEHSISAVTIDSGKNVLIPRIKLCPSDSNLPFTMSRKQFPVKVAFAMTINKAQGQTLQRVGIYLPSPVFSHGQLYVAFSRAPSFRNVSVSIIEKDEQFIENDKVFTRNIVFREVI